MKVFALVVVLVVGVGAGALAWADHQSRDEIPDGVQIAGIDVGGMTEQGARDQLRQDLAQPAARPVRVRVGGQTLTLSAKEAGVRIDLAGAVRQAVESGRGGSFVSRGWRSLSGGTVERDIPAPVEADAAAVKSFVGRLRDRVGRSAKDAELDVSITDVSVKPGETGRRLADPGGLQRRITKALSDPDASRDLRASVVKVQPQRTAEDVWNANPVVVTVAADAKRVRVFRRGELEKTYRVAVGSKEYPTPLGQFSVQSMQKNPTWNVPDSEWAGDLAGQTIPGGDPRNPLKARWIGFNGSVGFHGTADIGSLGNAASHGCVRMNPSDVIDLYKRVEVGTTVLVA